MTQLTVEQFDLLKTAVRAEPTLTQAILDGADYLVKQWLDTPTTFYVWMSSVHERELMLAFDWTRVDNLSVGKERIWSWMFRFGTINPSVPEIRAGLAAVWTGTVADNAIQAAVLNRCKRVANNAERVLAPALLLYLGL